MITLSLLLILLSCIVIWRACDGFEAASEYLGRNLTEGVRGATINAIGSSIPELFTTMFFLFVLFDRDGFSAGIGTTAGSAIFNGMIIPAAVIFVVIFKGVVSKVEVSSKVILRDGIALILAEFILILMIGSDTLTWVHGAVLMAMYFIYVIYMLTSMRRDQAEMGGDTEDDEDDDEGEESENGFAMNIATLNLESIFVKEEINSRSAWYLLSASTLVIGAACLLLVIACEWLGDAMNIPIYFIAVVLASAATSVPDTMLSMKDAQKGNYDDAVSNALGSNIFDICFALGLPLFLFTILFGAIQMSPETVENITELRILLLIFTIAAFFIYFVPKSLGLQSATLLILIYVIFTLYIFGRATDVQLATDISVYLRNVDSYFDYFRFWK